MNEESVQAKKPDEIYCPGCAKPIKKEAVVCPHCGVQVKELKVTTAMSPEEELKEGAKQLGGIKVFYWFMIVVLAVYFVILMFLIFSSPKLAEEAGAPLTATPGNIIQSMTVLIFVFGIGMALYIIPLVGIIKRRPYSVPFTRAMLIITMFGFPIGTIIGAALWKRINHPTAKKYLNYGA